MNCLVCGAAASADAGRFCTRCGAALGQRCPDCGRDNPPGAAFCAECGVRLAADGEPQGAAAPRSDVERRQLTVLFCDLVGSTPLAAALDPEDLRQLMAAYQRCCAEVVGALDGHVAKYLGDGVLAFFGYPQAQEGDAERAVRAGLQLIEAVAALPPPAGLGPELRLEARVGVATGLVVVGDLIGAGAAKEEAVVGETPNLAARLQTLAEPGSLLISARTRRLIGDLFDCVDLGEQPLKGFAQPVPVSRVLAVRRVDRFAALRAGALTPLVGREQEILLLGERWREAAAGEGQVVVLAGEPGIGKSRIVMALQEQLAAQPHTLLRFQCLPYYRNSPLQPVIDELERAAAIHRDDDSAAKLDKLARHLAPLEAAAALLPLLAGLLSIPTGERAPAVALSPQRRKAKTLAALDARLRGLATQAPALIVFEDVHWIDPTSRELLEQLVDGAHLLPALVVITQRPAELPLRFNQANLTALGLSRLSRRQGSLMIERMTAGRPLPDELVERIVERADGVPLFIEELTKSVLEQVAERGGRAAPGAAAGGFPIPESLQDSLTARLDRLGRAKEVAQIAAVIGREFSYELLAAVAPLAEAELRAALARLVETELVFCRGEPPDALYTFKHALVQETAYHAVLRERREELHARIARTLAADFPEVLESRPELIAYHCTEAGLDEEAVEFWREAGERAISRSAAPEAVAHLTSALQVLAKFPESRHRNRTELGLQTSLGAALIAARSFAAPETGRAYERAWQLCGEQNGSAAQMPVLFGRWIHHVARAELAEGVAVADEMLRLAEAASDDALLLIAYRALANTRFFIGDLAGTRSSAERALAIYDPARHGGLVALYSADPYVLCGYFLAHSLLRLGHPLPAREAAERALARAREQGHAVTLANALHHHCLFHQLAREPAAVREQAQALITFATEHALPFWQALGRIFLGWALAGSGQPGRGRTLLREGLAAYRATSGRLYLPYALALLADVCQQAGERAAGLAALAEARAVIETTGVRGFAALVRRLEGRLLLSGAAPDPAAAERCFREAMSAARSQGARLPELRAALDLAELWRGRGGAREAYDLVAPLYTGLKEARDAADVRDAAALLDRLD